MHSAATFWDNFACLPALEYILYCFKGDTEMADPGELKIRSLVGVLSLSCTCVGYKA